MACPVQRLVPARSAPRTSTSRARDDRPLRALHVRARDVWRTLTQESPMRPTTILPALLLLVPLSAGAQEQPRSPMGSRYTLVLDQLSGFRASAFGGNGFTYAG